MTFLVCVQAVGLCSKECCRLHKSNAGPLEDHVEGVQSLKPMRNPHWLLDYLFIMFSRASLCALNSLDGKPIVRIFSILANEHLIICDPLFFDLYVNWLLQPL